MGAEIAFPPKWSSHPTPGLQQYHQIHVEPADLHEIAMTTPFGLFEFLHTQFGLRNTASDTIKEHEQHLQLVFAWLSQCGIIINPAKCQFEVPSLKILGAFNQQTWHPPNS